MTTVDCTRWYYKLLVSTLPKYFACAVPKPTPQPQPQPEPEPEPEKPTPEELTDDPACNLVIKCAGAEVSNEGQVTYIKRLVVSKPFKGAYPAGVQFNVAGVLASERTVWIDKSNRVEKRDQLPTDVPIDKLVVWFERA